MTFVTVALMLAVLIGRAHWEDARCHINSRTGSGCGKSHTKKQAHDVNSPKHTDAVAFVLEFVE